MQQDSGNEHVSEHDSFDSKMCVMAKKVIVASNILVHHTVLLYFGKAETNRNVAEYGPSLM